jgi:2,4-dienoyl-CoA reductase-like NADH-dependent reductase (Old Yellow Enzyme family)
MTTIAKTPISLGPVILKNRIVRTAHGTFMPKGGGVNDDLIAFQRERARGGCAMTIIEAGAVHKSSLLDLAIWGEEHEPGLRRLAEACHEHGMKVFQQLWHGGNLYPGVGGTTPVAVSERTSYTGLVPRRATGEDIAELVEAFRQATLRCRRCGLDGVEVHAGHGYAFAQFLSPAYNDRDDDYGGPLENRARFLLETLRAVREAAGGEIAVGVRLAASDAPGFLSVDEVAGVLDLIQAEGLIDYVNVSHGDYYFIDNMVGGMHNPAGYELAFAGPILARANVPRIVAGRFRAIDEAETVLREGVADMVSMARAHIADPYLVEKSFSGREDEVRPCMGCNQGCGANAKRIMRVGCTLNPAAGFEAALAEKDIRQAARPRKVLVVGGGPAGLEAARTARLMGHQVVLAEASSRLGGGIAAARRGPRMQTFGDALHWFEHEVARLGVQVRLGAYMEADDIRAEAPEAVIIATGSQPRLDAYQLADPGLVVPGIERPQVISAFDLLMRNDLKPDRVAILDTVGGYEGICAMEQALSLGAGVTFVTHLPTFAPSTDRRGPLALDRAMDRDLEVLVRHRLVGIGPDHVLVSPLYGGDRRRRVEADLVVLVTQNQPLRDLYEEIRGEFAEVALIGDAALPRDMQYAIADGHRAARALV